MWFKVDDRAHSHPKVIEAGNAAMGLWMRCGSWSGEKLTEGYIPRKTARMFGTLGEIRRLVEVGLFLEVDGGYQMHDYLKYNLTADQVKELRGKRSEAGRKGALSRWNSKANAMAPDMASAMANQCPEPEPEPVGVSTQTDRQTVCGPVGLSSVALAAVELKVADALQRGGNKVDSRHRYADGIRRNTITERRDDLERHLAEHPDHTPEQVATAVFGLTELDIYRARHVG